ncbi:MAG: phosphotransferase [bacterium]|nr:phosphotransferase [bacterium]
MSRDLHCDTFDRLAQAAIPGGHLVHVWPLEGGFSAQITAMEISRPDGTTHKLIVRQYGNVDRKAITQTVRDEYKLLEFLTAQELAVPTPVYLDDHGEFLTEPCMVMKFMDGDPNFEPDDLGDYLMQMADHLSLIHKLDCASHDLSFLPSVIDHVAQLIAARGGKVVAATVANLKDILVVLDKTWPPIQKNPDVLLHGDYWPGNIICQDDRLTSIIDWEAAKTGDPLADLAVSRMEVLWAFGREAMIQFTDYYVRNSNPDTTALPYWDLYMALRQANAFAGWAAGHPNECHMREGHRYIVDQAVKQLQ